MIGVRGFAPGALHWTRHHPERIVRGEQHKLAKLTDDAVRAIREARVHGASLDRLATTYAVSKALISMVVNRRIWTHVQ